MSNTTSRSFCFTRNFNSREHADGALADLSWFDELPSVIKYCVFQLEAAPTTGRPHWQGYIELDASVRPTGVANKVPELHGAHFEARRGEQCEAIAYCKKEPRLAGPFEFGEPARQGKKRQCVRDEAAIYVRDNAETVTIDFLDRNFTTASVMYHKQLMDLKHRLLQVPADDSAFQPYPWQQRILNMLAQPANDRSVIWVTDTQGGRGKSRLAKHLLHMHGATKLQGKLENMIYAYKQKLNRIVIFDISRAAAEYSDNLYAMAEGLKDGALMNQKYESSMFFFTPPHVIFFANFSWDRSKFTHDRVIEIDLSMPEPPSPTVEDMEALDRCLEDVFRFM